MQDKIVGRGGCASTQTCREPLQIEARPEYSEPSAPNALGHGVGLNAFNARRTKKDMVGADAFGPAVAAFEESQKTSAGRRWWSDLPRIVMDLETEWGVKTGQPFAGGSASWVAPGTTSTGDSVVLKVSLPHREARGEAAALALWNGSGAVRLYRHDADRWALLEERCEPGTPLLAAGLEPERALTIAAELLRRLWSVPVPSGSSLEALQDVTREWAGLVRERMARHRPPLDPGVVELGAQLLERLPLDAEARNVVLHGDFNPGNVLSAQREAWVAIDAKPMVGDAAYDPAPMVGQIGDLYELADDVGDDVLIGRHRVFADIVGQPTERIVAWACARLVESALWHVNRNEHEYAEHSMRVATRLARLGDL